LIGHHFLLIQPDWGSRGKKLVARRAQLTAKVNVYETERKKKPLPNQRGEEKSILAELAIPGNENSDTCERVCSVSRVTAGWSNP
jgi:hypothetical protein